MNLNRIVQHMLIPVNNEKVKLSSSFAHSTVARSQCWPRYTQVHACIISMIHIVGVDKVYSMLDWEDQRPHAQQTVIVLYYSIAREVGKIVFMLTCSCNKKREGIFFFFFFFEDKQNYM